MLKKGPHPRDKYRLQNTTRSKLVVLLPLFALYLFYTYYLITEDRGREDNNFARGKMVWQKYNCSSCHQLYGLGGFLGPDLTHVQSRGGSDYIQAMIQSGTATMPAFSMDSSEMRHILVFFEKINKSGKGDPRHFEISADGFISAQ